MQFLQCNAKDRVSSNTRKQIVLAALFLNHLGSGHGVHTDALMQLLTVGTALDGVHHNILCGHEGQFPTQMLLNHLRIYHQTICNIVVQIQNAIHR